MEERPSMLPSQYVYDPMETPAARGSPAFSESLWTDFLMLSRNNSSEQRSVSKTSIESTADGFAASTRPTLVRVPPMSIPQTSLPSPWGLEVLT